MRTNGQKDGRRDKKQKESYLSWRQLFGFYRQMRIPWWLFILTAAFSFGIKQLQVMLVPYQSKIMTGAITEYGFLGGFIAITIAYELVEIVQGGLNELSGVVTARNARRLVWRKMLHLPMSYYEKRDPQSLVSRVTQDTTGSYAALASIVQLFSIIYGLYTSFQKMFITYKNLALIMLSVIPITMLSTWIVGKMQYKITYIINSSISAITSFFSERLPNILHIKTSNMEDEEYKKGVKANNDRFKAEVKQENIFIFMSPISTMAQYINQIILLVVATALVRNGTMKMFQLVNLYNYFLLFMSNAFMITSAWQSVKNSHGACATIAKITDAEPENYEKGEPVGGEAEDIEFEDVSFSYDGTNKVLRNVSFTIPKGKITAIVGENGSGKSTIIKLLERFNELDSGSIRVGDKELGEINLVQWREAVGYLIQGEQMIKGNIAENIAYGIDREYTQDELIEAAKLANAYDFICSKEKGFETEVNRFETKCSGGEMQRIAIARIIMKKPKYLLMDEATSGIDMVSANEAIESLNRIMEGKTVIMVSHNMEMIKKADHIVVLGDGEVKSSGTFEHVSANSELFRNFLSPES